MVSVAVNGRTVVHKQSGGISLGAPDPCLTPPANMPVPYLNVAFSRDATDTAASVFCDHEPVMKASSHFGKSIGDEPGTGGGVLSGCNRAKATFTNFSFDVLIEGEPTPRAFDPMMHNHNQPNCASPAELQDPFSVFEFYYLCVNFCVCSALGGNTPCLAQSLGEYRSVDFGVAIDSFDPFLHVEPGYAGGTEPMVSSTDSRYQPGKKLVRMNWWEKGSRRPDIVAVYNPLVPPVAPNIRVIYEAKFGKDDWRAGQKEAYKKIAGAAPIVVLSEKTCCCTGDLREPVPHTYPVWFPENELDGALEEAPEETDAEPNDDDEDKEPVDADDPDGVPWWAYVLMVMGVLLLRVPIPAPA